MGERDPFSLAAGQLTHFRGRVGNIQLRQHRPCICLDLPAAVYLQLVLQVRHPGQQIRVIHARRQIVTNRLIIADRLHHPAARRKYRLQHRQLFVIRRILRQICQRLPLRPHDPPRIRLFQPGQNPQKRSLPRPVRPNNPNLIAVFQTKSDILKKRPKPVVF